MNVSDIIDLALTQSSTAITTANKELALKEFEVLKDGN